MQHWICFSPLGWIAESRQIIAQSDTLTMILMRGNDCINAWNVSYFVCQVYVLKRPYVDEFLQKMGELFECVLFTASLAKVSTILWSEE